MNVLIIPEHPANDQFILKPLFERLFRSFDRRARVQICNDPVLGNVQEALKSERIEEIVERYRAMVQIFVLCVDRDGEEGRRQRLNEIENEFDGDRSFLAENAWEEIETWLLAGLDLPEDWRWADVRGAVHVKEAYFEPLASMRSVADGPGGGRKVLGEEAARQVHRIRQMCREDFDALARRLEATA